MAKQIARLLKTNMMADIDMPALAQFLRSQGRKGDTVLAHINPKEAALLQKMGGAGTENPATGLPEFYYQSQSDFYEPYGGQSRPKRIEVEDFPIREYVRQPNERPIDMGDPDMAGTRISSDYIKNTNVNKTSYPTDGSFSFYRGANEPSSYLEYDPRRLPREPMFTGAGNLDAPVVTTQFDPRMGFGGAGETSAAYRYANYGDALTPRSFAANLDRPPIPAMDLSGVSYNELTPDEAAIPEEQKPGMFRRGVEYLKDLTGLSGGELAQLGLAAGLGIQGARGAREMQEQGEEARREQEAIAAPYRERGAALLAQAEGGQLTPQAQQSLQAMRARLAQGAEARGGVGAQQVAAQVEAFRQQLLANQYDYGMKVSNIGDNLMLGAIRTGLEADRYATQMTNNYYTNMARILGGMGGGEEDAVTQPTTVRGVR
jgi:hypothetical protein